MSFNEEPLRIWIEISDRAVPSTGASRDIVLCRLQAVQEGEESVAESGPVYVAAHSVNLQRRKRHPWSIDFTMTANPDSVPVAVMNIVHNLLGLEDATPVGAVEVILGGARDDDELYLNRRHTLQGNPRFKYSNRCT